MVNASAKLRGACRRREYSATARQTSSPQKAGLRLLASSGGRSGHANSQRRLTAAIRILRGVRKQCRVVAVPSNPDAVGKHVVRADAEKTSGHGPKGETRLGFYPVIELLACATNDGVLRCGLESVAH